MSESTFALDHQSVDLLLSVMETSNATIAGAVLSDYYEQQAGQLMSANLLEPCGHQLVTTSMADHDDAPVSLTWSTDHNGYGYFSPSAGWIMVPEERLAVFAIKFPVVLAQMMVRFDIASRGGAVPLLPELLWEIGDARISRRSQRVPVWFARRLYDQSVWRQIKDVATRRPLTHLRVLLTSTPSARLPDQPLPGHLIVPIRDVIDFDCGLAVRPEVLIARLDGTHRPDVREAVYLSPSGQQLIINGDITIELKSDIHIKVIRQLVQGFKEGKRLGARDLLDHAQSSATTLRQAFGSDRWARLEPYLKSRNGLWGFEP
jgi:hypothetical protein